MKSTIFLSLVAGAMIFAGCGGGGGGSSTSGGSTSGGSTSGGSTSGGVVKTYSPFTYGATKLDTADLITFNAGSNLWIVDPNEDDRKIGATASDKTYAEAEKFCADINQSLPSPKDLLTTAMKPNDGTSAAWAKGKFIAYINVEIIGQSTNENAGIPRKVICMEGTSIEKKHKTTDITVDITEGNTTKQLVAITDVTTGLSWTQIHTYDKDVINPGHANESRFPLANATGNDITAAEYCAKFGPGWELPTLAELRTITYLDGTTSIPDPENLKPTIIWTKTPGVNAGTSYAIHLNPNNQNNIPYYSEAPEENGDKYFVTCVKK
jgi:hypothetical protein